MCRMISWSLAVFLLCARVCGSEEASQLPLFGVAIEGLYQGGSVLKTERLQEATPQIIEFFLQWPSPKLPPERFDWTPVIESMDKITQALAIPCLTWEPFFFEKGKKHNVLILQIREKKYDAYLRAAAEKLKKWGHPVIIRLAHEMNLSQYHWGTPSGVFNSSSPPIYVELYRYVVEIFKKAGVKNVLWAFCPNAYSVPHEEWNKAQAYYPGDAYVDILGMDGYNWGATQPGGRDLSFEQIFAPMLKTLNELKKGGPIFVFETGSVGTMPQKQLWLAEALRAAARWGIKAVIWFNIDKENNWQIILDEQLIRLTGRRETEDGR